MAISVEALEQMQQAMSQLPAESSPMAPVERDEEMKGKTKPKVREFPQITVYHLQYDAQGKVIDYHLDHWRKDANGMLAKLARRNEFNKPIWVLRLPAGVTKPAEDITCRHPQCGRTFHTLIEEDLHMRHQHREFYQMLLQNREQEDREQQKAAMQVQTELLAKLLGERAPKQRARKGAAE